MGDATTPADREAIWRTTLHDELRAIAARHMAREREGHTLDPTAIVHEVWLRMADRSWQGRTHVKAVAARMIARVLVDHARARAADKRGGDRTRVPLEGIDGPDGAERVDPVDALALRDALERLGAAHERPARVVELRVFGGLTLEEVAAALGVGRDTAKLDWRFARAWLHRELGGDA